MCSQVGQKRGGGCELCKSLGYEYVQHLNIHVQGVRTQDVQSCLKLLRDWVVGTDWKSKLTQYWRRWKRPNDIFDFQNSFGRVVLACNYPIAYEEDNSWCVVVREKLDGLLTKKERKFLEKKGVDVFTCDWLVFWNALQEIHDSSDFKEAVARVFQS